MHCVVFDWMHHFMDRCLNVFAKLRKPPINFVVSVRPSVRLSPRNNSAPTGRIFVKFDIWSFFRNYGRTNSSFIKIWQNNGYISWRPMYSYDSMWTICSYSGKCFRRNQNIKLAFKIFFRKSWRLWDYVEKYDTPEQATTTIIRRMRIAC
jgi:hypothetical protein